MDGACFLGGAGFFNGCFYGFGGADTGLLAGTVYFFYCLPVSGFSFTGGFGVSFFGGSFFSGFLGGSFFTGSFFSGTCTGFEGSTDFYLLAYADFFSSSDDVLTSFPRVFLIESRSFLFSDVDFSLSETYSSNFSWIPSICS